MKPIFALFTILLLAPLVTQAQQAASNTVRDRLWMFAGPADSDRGYMENAGVRGASRMTPAEACYWLDVPNIMFIKYLGDPPDMWFESKWKAVTSKEQYAISFEPLRRVLWSAVGSGGLGGANQVGDIVTLAKKYPNFTGIYLDDFVKDRSKRADGKWVGKPAMTGAELKSMRDQLGKVGRPMEVWTTIYTREFDRQHPEFTDCDPPLVESMKLFDVLVLWTWLSDELRDLEKNLALLESFKPKNCRIALGVYLWDYTGIDPAKKSDPTYRWGKPVPLDLMEHQCSLGLKWLKEGRVSDLVILGNTHLDLGINTAPWMREWVKKHGSEKLNR